MDKERPVDCILVGYNAQLPHDEKFLRTMLVPEDAQFMADKIKEGVLQVACIDRIGVDNTVYGRKESVINQIFVTYYFTPDETLSDENARQFPDFYSN